MSMLGYVKSDLFEFVEGVKKDCVIAIPHVCNDKGAWGAGFVLPLAKHYPNAKFRYITMRQELGKVSASWSGNEIVVFNMVAQTLGGERPLYYNHLAVCMDKVGKYLNNFRAKYNKEVRIIAPAFGSGLAGGDWQFIESLIYDCWIELDLRVTICYLDKHPFEQGE